MTTFLERCLAHKGGLVRLKTELFWYNDRGYDKRPGRICLLLDADIPRTSAVTGSFPIPVTDKTIAARTIAAGVTITHNADTYVLFLIDGSPHWVWLAEADVEVLNDIP